MKHLVKGKLVIPEKCREGSQTAYSCTYEQKLDIDLKTFFDEVNHCCLLQLLYRKIKCPETMRLIRKWLRSPIQVKG